MVPEIYDPETDRTIALENARKLFNMYSHAYIVQTGPKKNDWKVAVIGEADQNLLPGLNVIGQYDPWTYTGRTYFLDVQAALKDPNRDIPAENHWELIATAEIAHDSGAGAQLWELDDKGQAILQKVILFGGGCGRIPRVGGQPLFECNQATVEMIDFQDEHPQWERQDDLIIPGSQNNAIVLPTGPDGKVVVVGGALGRGPWGNSFHYQIFTPEWGTITAGPETTVPRHDHSTCALLPDVTIICMGGNRTDLANDPSEAGQDIGVPVAQIYKPSYLFNGDRPVIEHALDKISYRRRFVVKASDGSDKIGSVGLSRIGPITHNWDWGNRYVKLWFKEVDGGKLIVQAPAAPGLAVPGYYMLFVISDKGVPSLAKLIHLN